MPSVERIFMMGRLSELYTETLIPGSLQRPAVVLNTPAGRVLFDASWSATSRDELEALLDVRFARSAPVNTSAAVSPGRIH